MLSMIARLLLWAALSVPAGAAAAKAPPPAAGDGIAEAKLIQVYRLVGAGQSRQALHEAESLVRQFPNFQLAQLVHGDLLAVHERSESRCRRQGSRHEVIALTGRAASQLGVLADVCAATPAGEFADRVQELHIKVIQIMIELVERHFFPHYLDQPH